MIYAAPYTISSILRTQLQDMLGLTIQVFETSKLSGDAFSNVVEHHEDNKCLRHLERQVSNAIIRMTVIPSVLTLWCFCDQKNNIGRRILVHKW